jgi:fucose permease
MKNLTGAKVQLLMLTLMNYFTFALITNIPGVLFPFWKSDFHLDTTVLTFLGSAFFIAYGVTSLPLGFLRDNAGSKKTFLLGVGLMLLGTSAFAFFPTFNVGLISLFVTGVGITALQLVGNLLVKKIDDDPAKYASNLTLAQVCCGIGGSGGAILLGYLINSLHFTWQSIYYVFAGLSLLLFMFALATPIEEDNSGASASKPAMSDYFKLAANPLMMLFALGIFVYVGIEVGVASWISNFILGHYQDKAGELIAGFKVDPIHVGYVVALYWAFQSVGRFTGGLVLRVLSAPKALIIYSLAGLGLLVAAVTVKSATVAAAAFIGVGFFTSIMFSSIFSLAVNSFDKRQEGTVAGVLCTAIVGGAVTAPLIGYLASVTHSLSWGLIIAGIVSFLYIAFVGARSLNAPASPALKKVEVSGVREKEKEKAAV